MPSINDTGTAKWTADIKRFSELAKVRMDEAVRVVGLQLLEGVLLMSPVDTGRFRGSWRVSIATPDLSVAPPKPRDSKSSLRGAATTGEITALGAKLNTAKATDTIYITNNLPYAIALENGHSKQAPSPPGIVRPVVREVVRYINQSIEALETAQAGGVL